VYAGETLDSDQSDRLHKNTVLPEAAIECILCPNNTNANSSVLPDTIIGQHLKQFI